MARRSGELKKRCWLAKQRLKMGYWESLRRDAERSENNDTNITHSIAVEYARRLNREAEIAAGRTTQTDERMYRKVCDMLDSSEVTLNPIGQLIEREVYDNLDPAGKQRYVLELSDKFRQLKERYYRERTGT